MDTQSKLDQLFVDHKVNATCAGSITGPTVTRYNITLGAGVRPEKIKSLLNAIGYTLDTDSVRLVRGAIEVPSERRTMVEWLAPTRSQSTLSIDLGTDVAGTRVGLNLALMPHIIVAGATGSGKSAWLNSLLCTLIARNTPDELELLLIDPKQVELTPYEDVPHLVAPIIVDGTVAKAALDSLVDRMEDRYAAMRVAGVRNVDDYNRVSPRQYTRVVVVVDELADLMMSTNKAVERPIVRLGQKGRAAGIHLVLATQRPSVDVVTGLIKSNVPARLAFATASMTDSRVVLDRPGAEKLIGRGDGLYLGPESLEATRFQGPWIDDATIASTVADAVRRYGRSTVPALAAQGPPQRRKLSLTAKVVALVVALAIGAGIGAVESSQQPVDQQVTTSAGQ